MRGRQPRLLRPPAPPARLPARPRRCFCWLFVPAVPMPPAVTPQPLAMQHSQLAAQPLGGATHLQAAHRHRWARHPRALHCERLPSFPGEPACLVHLCLARVAVSGHPAPGQGSGLPPRPYPLQEDSPHDQHPCTPSPHTLQSCILFGLVSTGPACGAMTGWERSQDCLGFLVVAAPWASSRVRMNVLLTGMQPPGRLMFAGVHCAWPQAACPISAWPPTPPHPSPLNIHSHYRTAGACGDDRAAGGPCGLQHAGQHQRRRLLCFRRVRLRGEHLRCFEGKEECACRRGSRKPAGRGAQTTAPTSCQPWPCCLGQVVWSVVSSTAVLREARSCAGCAERQAGAHFGLVASKGGARGLLRDQGCSTWPCRRQRRQLQQGLVRCRDEPSIRTVCRFEMTLVCRWSSGPCSLQTSPSAGGRPWRFATM